MPIRCRTTVLALLFILTMTITGDAYAGPGAIAGKISDAESREPVEGARVRLAGTVYGTVTESDGSYRLINIPAGKYTIDVGYIGYVSEKRAVTVRADQATVANITIVSETTGTGAIIVDGRRLVHAWRLNRERNSDVIITVLPSNGTERYPVRNAADMLQQAPSVTVSRDLGVSRYVMVRGMRTEMTAVSVDGVRMLSPHSDVRSAPLDGLFPDEIAMLEVVRTLSPEMDADAAGGAVNIATHSAGDFENDGLSGTFKGGVNTVSGIGNGEALFRYVRRSDRLGMALTGNYGRDERTVHSSAYSYADAEIDGAGQTVLSEFSARDYEVERTRYGGSLTLDYALDDGSRLYLLSRYSRFEDGQTQRSNRYVMGDGTYTGVYSAAGGSLFKELSDYETTRQTATIAAGGEHLLDNPLKGSPKALDYQVAYAYAGESTPGRYDTSFGQSGLGMSWSGDADFPRISVDDAAFFDYSSYSLDNLTYTDMKTAAHRFSGQVNVAMPVQWYGAALDIKYGANASVEMRENDSDVSYYSWGSDSYTLDSVLGSYTSDSYKGGDMGEAGRYQDPGRVISHFNANRGLYSLDEAESCRLGDINTYEADEGILAAYGQVRYTDGRLSVFTGLRIEYTLSEYRGSWVSLNDHGTDALANSRDGSSDHVSFLPSVQAVYEKSGNTIYRMALTSGLSRPRFNELVPYRLVDNVRKQLFSGNPDLDATQVTGVDFTVDHYNRPLGVVSGGLFYKYFTSQRYQHVSSVHGGIHDGYELTRWLNGDGAHLAGAEMNWRHRFVFLPGGWERLGVQANAVCTVSQADVRVSGVNRSTGIAGQSRASGNVTLDYDGERYQCCLSLNHREKFLSRIGESSSDDYYIDRHTGLDLSLSRTIGKSAGIFLEIYNLTDAPYREYTGDSDHPAELSYYGRWIRAGVKTAL